MKNKSSQQYYQLHIKSLDLNGQRQSTKIVDNLTKYDVLFLIDVSSLFKNETGLGGLSVNDKSIIHIFKETKNKHSEISEDIDSIWALAEKPENIDYNFEDDLLNNISDNVCEYLLDYSGLDNNYYRLFDSYQVYEMPRELVDVTEKFKNK